MKISKDWCREKAEAEDGLDITAISIPTRRHKAEPGECKYCDDEREAGNSFHPPHDASARCESGGHSHCSCGTCF